jgi:hypothetical protein
METFWPVLSLIGVYLGVAWFITQFPVLTVTLLLLGMDCGGDE